MVDGAPRYITVEECLELQGFPRDFKLIGNKDKQFKQVGNAVPTIIVEAIGTLAFGKI
jgi:DNA (cytosine-5)-methyltransferase 1